MIENHLGYFPDDKRSIDFNFTYFYSEFEQNNRLFMWFIFRFICHWIVNLLENMTEDLSLGLYSETFLFFCHDQIDDSRKCWNFLIARLNSSEKSIFLLKYSEFICETHIWNSDGLSKWSSSLILGFYSLKIIIQEHFSTGCQPIYC